MVNQIHCTDTVLTIFKWKMINDSSSQVDYWVFTKWVLQWLNWTELALEVAWDRPGTGPGQANLAVYWCFVWVFQSLLTITKDDKYYGKRRKLQPRLFSLLCFRSKWYMLVLLVIISLVAYQIRCFVITTVSSLFSRATHVFTVQRNALYIITEIAGKRPILRYGKECSNFVFFVAFMNSRSLI